MVQALKRPLFIAANLSMLLGIVLLSVHLFGGQKDLWAIPFGFAILFSGIERDKPLEEFFGVVSIIAGVIIAVLQL